MLINSLGSESQCDEPLSCTSAPDSSSPMAVSQVTQTQILPQILSPASTQASTSPQTPSPVPTQMSTPVQASSPTPTQASTSPHTPLERPTRTPSQSPTPSRTPTQSPTRASARTSPTSGKSSTRKSMKSRKGGSKTIKAEVEEGPVEVPAVTPPDAPIHDVRCGVLNAKLHIQCFVCPGIHQRCIEYGGKMITPRQFTIEAEKDKQKDWKGSIRFGRYNLRTMMESKTLDFYHHESNCSMKCQSRNYIKNRKEGHIDSYMLTMMVPRPASRSSICSVRSQGKRRYHKRKRSPAPKQYASRNARPVSDNVLVRLITSSEDQQNNIKADDQLSYTTTSGGNSTSPSVSSPPSSHQLNGHPNVADFNAITAVSNLPSGHHQPAAGLAAPTVQDPATSQLLNHLIEQQLLAHQQSQPQQQLINNLMQAVNKSQSPNDANAMIQMAMVAMQMSANQQQQQQQQQAQTNPALNNFIQQLLIAHSLGATQNTNFALPAQQATPYFNDPVFNVNTIRRVMEDEPKLFWARMRDLNVLEELLEVLTMSIDRLRTLYWERPSTAEEEDFVARRLSSISSMLDLSPIYGEKIRQRFLHTALIPKEAQMNLTLQTKDIEQKLKLNPAKRNSQVFDSPVISAEPDLKKMRII